MTPLIAGNWKMNGLNAELSEIRVIVDGLSPTSDVSAMICPPALILQAAAEIA
ncbi:MAG TPA: triose-phosphate isomerase, partial [Afifellaceae bacterium]|nr:triose-phosphate isomerase [Afifellaceae bacterium]